ncbi:MAG TPA: DUF3025 domain-containing protein [Polyangiaceae bacterium]|nr:DUF3025 domain-containing protein [Polyangiaceae bacterium]
MRPLVAVRRAIPFDRHFLTRSALFWPLARAAAAIEHYEDFPPLEALALVFEGEPRVRFVEAPPRRRRGAGVEARALYDARIALDGEVPTRVRCWHDLMNALVWGTFPRAKRALHARQHRGITEQLTPGARKLPPARTPELDALALLDEGGVVALSLDPRGARASGASDTIVFGHAIYESLVLGVAPAVVAAIGLDVTRDRYPTEPDLVRAVDRALAGVIGDETTLMTPRDLMRMRITTEGLEPMHGCEPIRTRVELE